MVERTLDAMARGGIHDQLGGGFHRYSTDERWLVPHFEKMLYDQALLARAYLEAYQVTGQERYAEVARGIFEYVLRDLRDPAGGFYSAEDAGEVGREGEFYVWTPEAIDQALGPERAALARRYYGVTGAGNFEGATILAVEQWRDAFAAQQGSDPAEIRRQLGEIRAALLAARDRRTRPHRDDKVLTDWNGLMIGALAYGARVLDEPRYLQAADAAAGFILERLQQDGRLLHRFRDGEALVPAFLDDYAFFVDGLGQLYEASFEPRWLEHAVRLAREMIRLFWDEGRGGFVFSGHGNEALIAKTKELYDGALPSGNSVAALDLVRLGQVTAEASFQQRAEALFAAFSAPASQMPQAFPQFLIALDQWLGPSQEIVIAGEPRAADTAAMVQLVQRGFFPRAVVLLHPPGPAGAAIERLVPFVKQQGPIDGRATAYVCERHVCRLPVTDPVELARQLETVRSGKFEVRSQ